MRSRFNNTVQNPWVVRFFLTTNAAFKRRKIEAAKMDNNCIDEITDFVLNLRLPHFIWVMEGGPIDIYKDQSCKAELVLDATANKNEDASIYMRIENTLIFKGIEITYADVPCTFRQFTHNLGER